MFYPQSIASSDDNLKLSTGDTSPGTGRIEHNLDDYGSDMGYDPIPAKIINR